MTQSSDTSNNSPEESNAIETKKTFDAVISQKPALPSASSKDQTRSVLAIRLLMLNFGICIGIAIFVAVDLWASKSLAWRLIEKLTEPTAPINAPQQTSLPNTSTPATPSTNTSDKSAEATQKLIVYKDLLKEASLNKELLTLLLTSQTALVSGALGFYFGGKDNDND